MNCRNLVTTCLSWFAGVALIVISAPTLFAANQGNCNGSVECLNPFFCPTGYCCSATRWKGCGVTGPGCVTCTQVNNVCNGPGSHTCICGDGPQSPCRLCYLPGPNSGVPGTTTCINESCGAPSFCNTDWIYPYTGMPNGYRFTCECQP